MHGRVAAVAQVCRNDGVEILAPYLKCMAARRRRRSAKCRAARESMRCRSGRPAVVALRALYFSARSPTKAHREEKACGIALESPRARARRVIFRRFARFISRNARRAYIYILER